MNNLLSSFKNDGYVYCLLLPLKFNGCKLVKIGKIEMKRNDTEQQVLNKLLRRYNTYYGDKYDVINFERVGNCHDAEKFLFENLKSIKYDREMYFYNEKLLSDAFEELSSIFPNIQTLLCKSDPQTLSLLNANLKKTKIIK